MLNFTGRVYECPKCGAAMDGYIEQTYNGEEEWAGCDKCLDGWKASELKIFRRKITREVVQFI